MTGNDYKVSSSWHVERIVAVTAHHDTANRIIVLGLKPTEFYGDVTFFIAPEGVTDTIRELESALEELRTIEADIKAGK